MLGLSCPKGPGSHLYDDLAIIEPVDAQDDVLAEDMPSAKILVTNLFNMLMPLIRYEISDFVTLLDSSAPCSCGSCFRKIASVHGRSDEFFYIRKWRVRSPSHVRLDDPAGAGRSSNIKFARLPVVHAFLRMRPIPSTTRRLRCGSRRPSAVSALASQRSPSSARHKSRGALPGSLSGSCHCAQDSTLPTFIALKSADSLPRPEPKRSAESSP